MQKVACSRNFLSSVLIALFVALFSLNAQAECGCEITLVNGLETDDPGNGKITIAKIKTSDAGKLLAVYKNQWTGTRDIAASARTTFNLTVDGKCGNDHIFKFIRQNGLTCYATSACGRTVTCDDDNWD